MITSIQKCLNPISSVKTNDANMKDTFNLLKIIQFSEMDVQAGRTKPAKEVFSNLRRKYNLGR